MAKLNLESQAAYFASCLNLAGELPYSSIEAVAAAEEGLNAYPGLAALKAPRGLIMLEERANRKLIEEARRAVLDGRVFWEHAGAGEATRLKLGSKFLIQPHTHLGPDYLRDVLGLGAKDDPAAHLTADPRVFLPLCLGLRHLGQKVFELRRLAADYGQDPAKVLARQKTLLVVNEESGERIIKEVAGRGFMGLARDNFFFMIQKAFHGLTPDGRGGWRADESSPKRLHNHGQMAMQKTMDGQIFHLADDGGRQYLSREKFFGLLAGCDDFVSYNIEDLGYLGAALDFETIGLALQLGREGFRMTMEVVANNPTHPIKGGLCAYDPSLDRNVMVESFRLHNLAPEKITQLNKNFNHYPQPVQVFSALHEKGLFMPVAVKDGFLYFQPVQGDLNFLVETAFVSREKAAPISSWKSGEDTRAAVAAMAAQDAQPGFAAFIRSFPTL